MTRPARRGVVEIGAEDLHRLLKLGPGEHVSGVRTDDMRDAVIIRIDGDEDSDLPEWSEGMSPARVSRPFAMVELRRHLLWRLANRGEMTAEEFTDSIEALLREELLP